MRPRARCYTALPGTPERYGVPPTWVSKVRFTWFPLHSSVAQSQCLLLIGKKGILKPWFTFWGLRPGTNSDRNHLTHGHRCGEKGTGWPQGAQPKAAPKSFQQPVHCASTGNRYLGLCAAFSGVHHLKIMGSEKQPQSHLSAIICKTLEAFLQVGKPRGLPAVPQTVRAIARSPADCRSPDPIHQPPEMCLLLPHAEQEWY